MNKGYKSNSINNYTVRSYVINGNRIKVNIGSASKYSLNDIKALNNENTIILKGGSVSGHRVKWSNLYRVALIKILALRDGLQCNNPNCPTRELTKKYIKTMGISWLQIDHIDNNSKNNSLSNYQLLCSICNFRKK